MKKILISIMITAIFAATSISAFAATDKTAARAQTDKTTAASSAVKEDVFFGEKTLYNLDGSIAYVIETWDDSKTHDKRVDFLEPIKDTDTLQRTGGAYVLENGAKYIKVSVDAQGKLTGSVFTGIPLQFSNMMACEKQAYVNEYKEGTRRAGWKDKGTVKAADGTKLKKLSRTDNSATPGVKTIENVYLDKNSGLPVKGDISMKKNGVTSLMYTCVYTFDNVSNDESLFDTSGITVD